MHRGLGNEITLGVPIDGSRRPLRLTPESRSKHLYVVGSSGQGKSKFLEGLIRQDIESWPTSESGLLLIDPDGPIFDGVMDWLATSSHVVKRPIIPIDFRQKDFTVSYNPLRPRPDVESSVVVNNFVAAVAHVWGDDSVERTPLFARYAKSLIQALYERGGSLPDVVFFLSQTERLLRQAMIRDIRDPDSRAALEFADKLRDDRFMEELGSTIRRLHPFCYNRHLRTTFGGVASSLDLTDALEKGQIILVCLSQEGGNIDQTDAKLFATTLLADLWQTAGQRGKRDSVKPFYVYIDEFHEFLTPTIATTFARARGYGLHFTLAHQFPSQVIEGEERSGKRIFDSITGNAETIVAFQQKHPRDVQLLADMLFGGAFDPFKEKLRIDTTKVVAYEKILLHATSRTETSGASTSSSGESVQYDDEGEILGTVENKNSSISEGSVSESSSSHESIAPILGKELSSVQFLSLDEQRHLAIVALQTQGRQHAVTRIGTGHPIAFRTMDIVEHEVQKAFRQKYYRSLVAKLPIAIPFEYALSTLDARHSAVRERIQSKGTDEETPARRKLKKS